MIFYVSFKIALSGGCLSLIAERVSSTLGQRDIDWRIDKQEGGVGFVQPGAFRNAWTRSILGGRYLCCDDVCHTGTRVARKFWCCEADNISAIVSAIVSFDAGRQISML